MLFGSPYGLMSNDLQKLAFFQFHINLMMLVVFVRDANLSP